MIILELRFHDLVLKEYTLEKGDRLTIGRHPDNGIVKIGNDLNLKVFTISVKEKTSSVTEEFDDKSVVLSTIVRTLDKL